MANQQLITGTPAHSTTAVRWPSYSITGAGPLAVVLECCHRVVQVMMPLEAAALAGEKCCATCSHAAAPGAGLHRIVELEQSRRETPHRSMKRLPGWDED
jgi:hypothetical protein